ncbi:hypothetical protein ASPWEDRAFT_677357 [Aspergillus wentii DTO 134E9]|uniref:Nuclear speckle splicing regulatory protein 1 N-terminal domain-containing protein n=1 Tax=Aspergillus wentii DTO 134E9 TaxID=1073089 RepID=A0A1L9R7Y7_ASPWE|nr:uncharacterized protein ASPWEDRAFT_677357 [Aspergillus wentii DTO 134E9]KAI9927660.1 hypothetical protein MW887_003281 [Aspergillus wentii]OJJ31040.1 hypothetical protein ASPWEDRAFT_677357 [Aspergillus wentii DTO 134E9]
MPPLSLGLNLASKKQPVKPNNALGAQKRKKNLFDSDSEDETQSGKGDNGGAVEISTVGGVEEEKKKPTAPKAKGNANAEQPPFKKKVTLGGGNKPAVKPLSKSSIFADEDEDEGPSEAMPLGLNTAKKPTNNNDKDKKDNAKEYTNLSAMHSSKKHAQEAQELDPSIYSYDAVYDSLHAKPAKTAEAAAAEAQKAEVPKYMTALLRSAEVRKRDQLRARDRLLAKEREAEGDEFADKEKFVTAAYKAQQEELRRIEQEEEEREKMEEERKRKNGGSGMVGFYRDMLSRGEERHGEVVKAAEEAARRVKDGEAVPSEETAEEKKEKTEAQMAADLNASGANVAVNDEGQVVDKRQLLSAGLNVAPKPKSSAAGTGAGVSRPAMVNPRADAGFQSGRAGQRARQTEMIASQLEERARQEAEAEAARQKEIAERNRSRKTEGDVSSARERYLARKKEREAAGK